MCEYSRVVGCLDSEKEAATESFQFGMLKIGFSGHTAVLRYEFLHGGSVCHQPHYEGLSLASAWVQRLTGLIEHLCSLTSKSDYHPPPSWNSY